MGGFIKVLVPLLALTSGALQAPNIILVTVDELRPDALGCYHTHLLTSPTPHIDQLAHGSTVFSDAQSPSPSAHASAMSLLFGVHVPVHGVYDDGLGIPEAHFSRPLPKLLSSVGYVTASVGRPLLTSPAKPADAEMHLSDSWRDMSYDDLTTQAHHWIHTQQTLAEVTGASGSSHSPPWFLHLSLPGPANTRGSSDVLRNTKSKSFLNSSDAASLLENLDYQPSDWSHLPELSAEVAGLGRSGQRSDGADLTSEMRPRERVGDVEARARQARAEYENGVRALDAAMGKFLEGGDWLVNPGARTGALNCRDTVVVFTALRGSPLCDHGLGCGVVGARASSSYAVKLNNDDDDEEENERLRTASSLVGASSLAVPLLVRWVCSREQAPPMTPSSSPPSSWSHSPVSLLDVHATLLRAAGAPLPADVQGFSLLVPPPSSAGSLPAGGSAGGGGAGAAVGGTCPRVAFASHRVATVSSELWAGHALVTSEWKLCYYADQGEALLFRRRPRRPQHRALLVGAPGEGRGKAGGRTSQDGAPSSGGGKAAVVGGGGARQTLGLGFEHDNLWERSEASAGPLAELRAGLFAALLRWRARQDSLSLLWAQMAAVGYAPARGGGRDERARKGGGKQQRKKKAQALLNRNGKPRKARVVESARAVVEAMRGVDAEFDLQADVRAVLSGTMGSVAGH